LNDIGMTEKNSDRPSGVMDLGSSEQCAQVLAIPVKIISNMLQRIERTF